MDHETYCGNFIYIFYSPQGYIKQLCQILTDFQNSFTVRLSDKFATIIVKGPTVATLSEMGIIN